MSYTLIQQAKVAGQFDVAIGFAKKNETTSEYVVTYGCQVDRFPRTVEGLAKAMKEFEACHAHALIAAGDLSPEYDDSFED